MADLDSIFYGTAFLSAPASFYILAVVILFARVRARHARYWVALCLLAGTTWLLMYIVTRVMPVGSAALIAARLTFACGVSATAVFLNFTLVFMQLDRDWRAVRLVSASCTTVVVILIWGTDLVVKDVRHFGFGLNMPVGGPLVILDLLLVVAHVLTSSVLLARAFFRATGRSRLQLGYLVAAAALMAGAAAGSFIPTMGSYSFLAVIPTLLMAIAPAVITYAIIRHQLWDIRTVIHKTGLWLGMSAVALAPVFLLLRAWPGIRGQDANAQLALTVCLFAAFGLHFRVIQPRLDQFFARRKHDHVRVVDRFTHGVLNLRDRRAFGGLLAETLRRTLYPRELDVLSLKGEEGDVELVSLGSGDLPFPSLSEGLRKWLAGQEGAVDLCLLDRYRLDAGLTDELERLRDRVAVLLPLVKDGELIGLVTLGEKTNLRAYTREDFEILERIRPPATVALSNAILYDRISEMMLGLEERVEQRTRELEAANQQLRELDQAKNKLFANITHELRTPLTLILAPLEDTLLKGGDAITATDLEAMHRSGMRLLRQINALLDLAKADAGELRLRVEELALGAFVRNAAQNFDSIARRKGVRLEIEPLAKELRVPGDPEKLELVLSNLLANAIKFTAEGGVVVVSTGGDTEYAWIAVTDTGIGIPDDQLERIFDRFAQVESGNTRRFEGAGIGLSLVKEIVDLHGGLVQVRSVEGQGSEFRVLLRLAADAIAPSVRDRRRVDIPRADQRRAEDRDMTNWVPIAMTGEAFVTVGEGDQTGSNPRVQRPVGARPPRVMLVEDNPDMRGYLVGRLSRNYELQICSTGMEALAAVRKRPPDLVLSDVMMPEMSGYDLCQAIKTDPKTSALPVILLTARKGVERALEGFMSGADDYLTKPFNYQELQARIEVQLRLADATRRLADQEKRAVLSLVATGLAHEVRNPINAILNAARPLREMPLPTRPDSPEAEAQKELLGVILDAAGRVDTLVGDLLGVAREDPDEVSVWQVQEALASTIRLLRYKHGDGVSVETALKHTSKVVGNTSQLNQVLMNLLDNAMRAAGAGGRVIVATEQGGGALLLRVCDSGAGIPAGIVERIFDPLFTTRASEDATGLGLHISKRIVEQHRGKIVAHPHGELGGAEFVVELPLEGLLALHPPSEAHGVIQTARGSA